MRWTRVAARRALRGSACWALFAGALLSGCIVGETKCSKNQMEVPGDNVGCVCAEGAVPDPAGYGCMMCGEHEQAVAEKCECMPGYGRPAADMPCEEVSGSVFGQTCSADAPCSDPNPYCASANGASFCTTQGCKKNGDCAAGLFCDSPGASGFCRQPSGLGKSCKAAGDCAGGEATFCESFVTMTCIVEKCVSDPGICPSGNVCCDLTALAGSSLCTPTMVLMNGLCPDGKAPVSP